MHANGISLQNLRITLNGTFARALSDIDDALIEKIITTVRANEDADYEPFLDVRRKEVEGTKVSAFVYYSERDAYFLAENDLYDRIASYLVVVEVSKRELVIFKKSCATLTPLLERNFEVATYDELIKTFDDSRCMIQKLSTREMNISDKGVRARAYEAADLKGHMSPHAAGRSIPRFTQVRTREDVRSISLTTGRINQLTDRVSVGSAAKWAQEIFALMKKSRVDNSFFSTFAHRVSLEEVLKDARPASILFERAAIEEHLSADQIELLYVHEGKYKKLKPRSLKRILRALDTAFEVNELGRIVGTRSGSLRINAKTISPQSVALKRLKIEGPKGHVTFQSWITDHGYFVVSFSKPEYIYLKKSCFQDSAGRSEVDSILKCLQAKRALATTKSEKGEPKASDVSFAADSIFHAVERIHSSDDYIFCDDFGNEWADHITLNLKKACVTFIHSKHAKKPSNSASALHEVVGQAVKNLGNMHFNFATFSNKVNSKFKKVYRGSRIHRTRKGNCTLANSDIKILLADHRLHRKCIVACSSLSKKNVEAEFRKLKHGLPVKGHVTQLFWILSSFIHSAQGSSVVPIVYCRP